MMGLSSSTTANQNDSSSSVNTDSDNSDEYESFDSDMEVNKSQDDCLEADAAFIPTRPVQLLKKLTDKDLNLLNDYLDIEEKVALVYLLHNNPNKAYQEIKNLKNRPDINVVKDWAQAERKNDNKWHSKILEALCIIKNFQIIRLLGYDKHDLNLMFLPADSQVSLQVSLTRKSTYCIFETLKKTQIVCLTAELHRDFQRKGLNYDVMKEPNLELLFLNLERQNYISFNCIKNIAHVFKYADMQNEYDTLMYVNNKISTNDIPTTSFGDLSLQTVGSGSSYNIDETAGLNSRHEEELQQENYNENRNAIKNFVADSNDYYKVDSKKPGYIVIINNEHFFTEVRPKFKPLLEKDIELETRDGTEADKKALIATFKELNFQIKICDNKMHDALLQELETAVQTVYEQGYSSLFVTILSHGKKGVVYGCNSIAVDIENAIKPILCSPKLSGLPKVLLMQACQGNIIQKIEDELRMDGPAATSSHTPPPKMQDLLLFHSTIPNYAAFRHTSRGSWFIQSICEKINIQKDRDHFVDICTSVNSDVGKKNWNGKIMVPVFISTLTKKLYLTSAH